MQITRGKIPSAKKTVIYGPEGIGKSTFASRFPDVVFIDTEGSTNAMDVARLPRPSSWTMLLEEIDYVKKTPGVCKTLAIDTIDWAEQLCVEHICAKHHKSGIEDFGYGNGYVYVREEFGRLLNQLTDVIEAGINVVLTAHAQMRKFEQPDEMGAYDRWELKLGKKTSSQTSPLVKEWADMLLFCNYKTYSIAVDERGKKHKAQGGKRVMYTAHHPCWDAKNRYGLPDECEFDYSVIAAIINDADHVTESLITEAPQQQITKAHEPKEEPKQADSFVDVPEGIPEQLGFNEYMNVAAEQAPKASKVKQPAKDPATQPAPPGKETEQKIPDLFRIDEKIPKELRDLMEKHLVSEEELQQVVADQGYYPKATPILYYDPGFISGVLIAAWPQVYEKIKALRATYEIPF